MSVIKGGQDPPPPLVSQKSEFPLPSPVKYKEERKKKKHFRQKLGWKCVILEKNIKYFDYPACLFRHCQKKIRNRPTPYPPCQKNSEIGKPPLPPSEKKNGWLPPLPHLGGWHNMWTAPNFWTLYLSWTKSWNTSLKWSVIWELISFPMTLAMDQCR